MVKLWWYKFDGPNTGDMITPYILDKLGVKHEFSDDKEFIGAGSILQRANGNTVIGGSGIHKINDYFGFNYNKDNILAVRGKLTYDLLPDKPDKIVFGDPGLLLSKFYKPDTKKKYKVGILAHYTDYKDLKKLETPEMPVYNMMSYNNNPVEWIADRISECELIFSTSLHGIIFAHSLGVPAVHIVLRNLYGADSFKFKDYYSILDIPYKQEKAVLNRNFYLNYKYNKDDLLPSNVNEIQDNVLKALTDWLGKTDES